MNDTGATEKQLKEAVVRFHQNWGVNPDPDEDHIEFSLHSEYMPISETAEFLVPIDQRIVPLSLIERVVAGIENAREEHAWCAVPYDVVSDVDLALLKGLLE